MTTSRPAIRTGIQSDSAPVATLIHRSHTISFAPFASSDWVNSRDLSEYKAKWKAVLAEESEDSVTLVAVIDEAIAGTVHVSRIDSTEFDAQLNGMHVDPDQTGTGIGSLLMKKAIEFINKRGFERVELGVIASNSGARRFYETHGWALVRELPNGIEGVPIAIYKLA